MRANSAGLVLAASLALVAPATAGSAAKTYTGKATSLDTTFKYGKVTVKTKGSKVTQVKIESVTTTGCGGFMTVIFSPATKGTKILKGSATIKGGKLNVTYLPDATVEDQQTTIKATFKGSKVTGTFASEELCVNKGRFTAKR